MATSTVQSITILRPVRVAWDACGSSRPSTDRSPDRITFGGSIVHDLYPLNQRISHRERLPNRWPRRRTRTAPPSSAGQTHYNTKRRSTRVQGLSLAGRSANNPTLTVPPGRAPRGNRVCQIPIALTRGPRFSAIEFLRRLPMGSARYHVQRKASQKHHSCATYILWLC